MRTKMRSSAYWDRMTGYSFAFCLFFFQAEDGIRDLYVTGVQTCALPICFRIRITAVSSVLDGCRLAHHPPGWLRRPLWGSGPRSICVERRGCWERSEERRVGKECGRGRSLLHADKNAQLSVLGPHDRLQLRVLSFFFSSRRRHTRSLRDWSSDVCSSDLFPYQNHRCK